MRGDAPLAELTLAPTPAGGRRLMEAGHHLMAASAVTPAELDQIVVGTGPGGFTGLRIAIATALGLGQALDIPVVGAATLQAMALSALDADGSTEWAAAVIDARRREVFAAVYRRAAAGPPVEIVAARAWAPADFVAALGELPAAGRITIAGNGLPALDGLLAGVPHARPEAQSELHRPRAACLVRLVAQGAGRPARPTYLRLPDAEVNRRAARAR